MGIEDITSHAGPSSMPPLVAQIIAANGIRASKTLAYVSMPERNALMLALKHLKGLNPALYKQILDEGIVVDLGGGASIPPESSFEKHPLKVYISIDLNHDDETTMLGETLVVKKKGDFYSVLASLPDQSIPTIHLRMIDEIIIEDSKERGRLRALIMQKLKHDGVVISVASRIFPGTNGVETVYLQPNMSS